MSLNPRAEKANFTIGRVLALPWQLLKYSAFEPAITGPLLLALTRGPPELQQRLLKPFQSNLLARNGSQRLERFVRTLKFLFVWGLIKRVNAGLNRLALNRWHVFSKPGRPWEFGVRESGANGKFKELVLITGGCSGFGYEMVKAFAEKARVVILDVAPLPKEFENSKLPFPLFTIPRFCCHAFPLAQSKDELLPRALGGFVHVD